MASTKTGTGLTSADTKTTDPSAAVSGIHPTPEQAAEAYAKENKEYRERMAKEREENDRAISEGEAAAAVEGLKTSGTGDAKDAEDVLKDKA